MTEPDDNLVWLGAWYAAQCDGDWEHEYGVSIDTLDNPGWRLCIDLMDTELADRTLAKEKIEEPEYWLHVWKDDDKATFNAAGSPATLPMMIAKFRSWVTQAES